MSRHQAIRNLDLVEELADYDYEYDKYSDGGEEMSEQDKVQMASALVQVKDTIGEIPGCSNKVIEDILWDYYYDVPKTIDYILTTYRPATLQHTVKEKKKKQSHAKGQPQANAQKKGLPWASYQGQFSDSIVRGSCSENALRRDQVPVGFWDDAPWGAISSDRRAHILVEPIYPRGGLLGGSGGGKTSKLAALAKARKAAAEKKQQEAVGKDEKGAVSLLSKLTAKKGPVSPTSPTSQLAAVSSLQALDAPFTPSVEAGVSKPEPQDVPTAASPPRVPLPAKNVPEQSPPVITISMRPTLPAIDHPIVKPNEVATVEEQAEPFVVTQRASPSSFAVSMFGEGIVKPYAEKITNGTLFYYSATVNAPPAASNNAFAEPSPDDKVLAARSQVKGFGGGKAKKAKDPVKTPTPVGDVANGLKEMNLGGHQQPNIIVSNTAELERVAKTRKNLNVAEEYKKLKAKENANFVVIGHVDAGKSTLMGRLLYDLGVVDERTLKKYKQEAEKIGKSSFAFAWVLDQTSEERNRGVTIDIASNKFETENCSYTILDAPGHKDFIPNMIAGASQADFAVLVIDSTTGEFETGFNFRGQTKEHTLLVRSMGVQRIIVAVNKLDNVNWSSARFEEITTQIGQFLTTARFNPKYVSFVPCSGLTGDNVTKKPKEGLMPWYTGGTLVNELEKTKPSKRAIEKPFRLTVGDVFRGGVMHPVSVGGRVDAGSIQVGDILVDMPTGDKAAVKSIEIDDEPRDWAVAGHNVVLHLAGIEIDHIRQGDILCDLAFPTPAVSSFNLKILAFESITPMMVDIHCGRLNAPGRVAKMNAVYDKTTATATKRKPRHIPAGSLASITIQVDNGPSVVGGGTIPVEVGTRIVLRAFGQTVAAGLVEA